MPKYFVSFTEKEIIILHSAKAHARSRAMKQQMGAKAKVQLKLLDVVEGFNDFIDMNGSIYG